MRPAAAAVGIIIVIMLSGCGTDHGSSHSHNIFGRDNRIAVDHSSVPWRSIGLLDSGCTGTLVDRRLVLTAAHCILDRESGSVNQRTTWFRPGFSGSGESPRIWIDYIWYGTNKPEQQRGQDWAILLLKHDAGDASGWIHQEEVDFSAALPYTVSLAGYSEDFSGRVAVHEDCYIHEISGDRLLNDCDSWRGISGGPLLARINGRSTVVGIAVSEYRQGSPTSVVRSSYDRSWANVAISSSAFLNTLEELRKGIMLGRGFTLPAGVLETFNPNSPAGTDQQPGQPGPRPARMLVDGATLRQRAAQIIELSRAMAVELQWIAIKAGQSGLVSIQAVMQQSVRHADGITNLMSDLQLGFRSSQETLSQLPVQLEGVDRGQRSLSPTAPDAGYGVFQREALVHINSAGELFRRISLLVYRP